MSLGHWETSPIGGFSLGHWNRESLALHSQGEDVGG